jgi:hypothetical protein
LGAQRGPVNISPEVGDPHSLGQPRLHDTSQCVALGAQRGPVNISPEVGDPHSLGQPRLHDTSQCVALGAQRGPVKRRMGLVPSTGRSVVSRVKGLEFRGYSFRV